MLSHGVFSQNRKVEKTFHSALEAYHNNELKTATKQLDKCLKMDSTYADAWLLKAEIASDHHDAKQAIQAYTKVTQYEKKEKPSVYFSLGRLQYLQADYRDAVKSLETFLSCAHNPSTHRKKAQSLLKSARFAQHALLHPDPVQIKHLNHQINTQAEEYINFVNEDSSRLIITRKYHEEENNSKRVGFREQFFDCYRKASGDWQHPQQISFGWAKGRNMGGLSLTADQKNMYFTGCYWPGSYGSCDIYQSRMIGNRWQNPYHPDKVVNSSSWDSQVCISPDGKRLLFASKRPGGKGGSDIWMSVRDSSGKWLPAVNLGDSINTAGDEMAPFLHADNQTLYFSSNGHPGMGGFDLFLSRKNSAGQWSSPTNLGYPVNTHADELNIFVSLDGEQAWISSNRDGNMDIYNFKTYASIHPQSTLFVKGKVVDAQTGNPLRAKVILSGLTPPMPIDSTWSDPANGHFFMVLHPGKETAFHIQKTGYLFVSKRFELKDKTNQKSISAIFRLYPIQKNARFILHNILFDFDRSTLLPASYPELNRLVELLQKNPQIKIRIAGYTDSMGSEAYNLKLSTQRAKVVYEYLINKGINRNRIEYKGFGSTHPVADNHTEAARAQNRRTEIIIR